MLPCKTGEPEGALLRCIETRCKTFKVGEVYHYIEPFVISEKGYKFRLDKDTMGYYGFAKFASC